MSAQIITALRRRAQVLREEARALEGDGELVADYGTRLLLASEFEALADTAESR